MEALQNESIYARKLVELFLDEEERSIEEDSEQEDEEEIEGDGHSTLTKKIRPGHQHEWGQKRNIAKDQESDPGNVLT